VVAKGVAVRLGAESIQAAPAVGIALDLGEGTFDLGQAGGVVLQLVLEGEDVAVADARSFLEALDGGTAGG
jgi:hypothetical protein